MDIENMRFPKVMDKKDVTIGLHPKNKQHIIVQLRKEGKTVREIAKELKLSSPSVVQYYLDKASLGDYKKLEINQLRKEFKKLAEKNRISKRENESLKRKINKIKNILTPLTIKIKRAKYAR